MSGRNLPCKVRSAELKQDARFQLRKRDHRGLIGLMGSDVLFHPDHVVPAVKLVPALIKLSDKAVAEFLMKTDAVFCQMGIVILSWIGNAGVEIQDVLSGECALQGIVEEATNPVFAVGAVDINRSLNSPVVSRAVMKRTGIGVADRRTVLLGNEIGVSL